MKELNIEIGKQHLALFEQKSFEIIAVIGGRSSGKTSDAVTAGALQMLNNIKTYKSTGVNYSICLLRENAGAIKNSIWRSFMGAVNQINIPEFVHDVGITDTNVKGKKPNTVFAYTLGFRTSNKSNTAKLKGMYKTNLYIVDEADETKEQDIDQLIFTAIRERARIFLLLNSPHKDHWIVKRFLDVKPSQFEGYFDFDAKNIPNFRLIKSNIKNNNFLPQEAKDIYLSYGDKNSGNYHLNKYATQVLGLIPAKKEGIVFTEWEYCEYQEFVNIRTLSKFGMDLGFTNDPTTLVEVKTYNGCIYIHEHFYKRGLKNSQINENLLKCKGLTKQMLIKGDGGGLGVKVLSEIKDYGWNIKPADKGSGSIIIGIEKIKEYKIYVTKESENLVTELLNYAYTKDGDGNVTNLPEDDYNHAIDAVRYAMSGKKPLGDGF